jgi:hypothetical protein
VSDAFDRRFERDALVIGLVMVAGAFAWPSGGWGLARAVAGGWGLAAFAAWSLRRGVNRALSGGNSSALALVNFFTRYAILALAAYVMLARFRVNPLGVAAGASWPVVAACAAAARSFFPARPGHPR